VDENDEVKSEAVVRNPHMVSVDYEALYATPDEHVLQRLVGNWYKGELPETTITLSGKQPGFATPRSGFHTHSYDQVFYMLAGMQMVQVEGEEAFEMVPGDVWNNPSGVMHRAWIPGPEKAFMLVINTPKRDG
jgi:mannose-6-phosphate isomerase-like protein (cupin superfamily)